MISNPVLVFSVINKLDFIRVRIGGGNKMTDIGVKGVRVKFHNKYCACPYQKKAEVRISEPKNNPGQLFF